MPWAQMMSALPAGPPPTIVPAPSLPRDGPPASSCLRGLGELKQTVLWKFSEWKRLSQAFCLNSPHLFSQPSLPHPPLWAPPPHSPFSFLSFSPLLLFFKRAELTALALSKANPRSQPEAASGCWPSSLWSGPAHLQPARGWALGQWGGGTPPTGPHPNPPQLQLLHWPSVWLTVLSLSLSVSDALYPGDLWSLEGEGERGQRQTNRWLLTRDGLKRSVAPYPWF